LQQQNDPDALVDYRTPRLDLDSLYGRGPADQPYMYNGSKFRLGRPLLENDKATRVRDLPRYIDPNDPKAARRALIGDKRNDENVIVSQLHAAMLQFHNELVDQDPKASFRDIQQRVRWHYQWIVVSLFVIFGAVAFVLAAVGLYGVMSFSVNQHTQEFGIRMALGADAARIFRMVMTQGAWQLVIGLILGSGAAALLLGVLATAAVKNILFKVDVLEPSIYFIVAALLTAVAAASCFVPARRATRVDPMVALRYE
jgi:ABC-type antimicrobial peptide transport system permease subunit